MAKTFLISDTHFSHSNILTFKTKEGAPLRPFSDINEMHKTIIDNWNKVVSPNDKVYHLGDVGFKNNTNLRIMEVLNGDKVLIKGNHDNLKLSGYQKYFRDIRSYHVLDNILLAHIPIHPENLGRWVGQVHGHTHSNNMTDPRYFNASVENINYTPIDFEEIRRYFKR